MMSIFSPAISLYNRLDFRQKFLLIGFITLMAVVVSISQTVLKDLQTINEGKQKLEAARYVEPLRKLFVNIAQTRGMTNSFLNGENSVEPQILEKRKEVDRAFVELLAVESEIGKSLNLDQAVMLQNRWNNITKSAFNREPAPVFSDYTQVIAQVLNYLDTVRRNGKLAVDPDSINAAIISLLMDTIPAQVEVLGRLRGKGAGVISGNDFSPASMLAVSKFADNERLRKVQKDVQYIIKSEPEISGQISSVYNSAISTLEDYLELATNDLIQKQQSSLTAQQFFDQGTQTISGILGLYDVLLPLLKERLNNKVDRGYQELLFAIIVNAVLLILIFYSFIAIYIAIHRMVDQLKTVSGDITEGFLDSRVSNASSDELGTIGVFVNEIASGFTRVLDGVIQSSSNVSTTSGRLAEISKNLADSMQHNRDQMTQASSAITEMSASISEIAQNTELASTNASKGKEAATSGNLIINETIESVNDLAKIVEDSVESIESLKSSSDNVAGILGTIRGIAEQTNLLALNAAIEAARAGEQGRGFAVVADEVRSLAQRTQESTTEIQQLIEGLQLGISEVNAGMDRSRAVTKATVEKGQESNRKMLEIVERVNEIVDINAQIAATATEQSVAANEVSESLTIISDQTDRSYEESERLAADSNQLSAMASELKILTQRFEYDANLSEDAKYQEHLIRHNSVTELNIDEADRQHQIMVSMMNEVLLLILKKRSKLSIGKAMGALSEYTEIHFIWEENFMGRNGFPGLEEHKKAHKSLIDSLMTFQREFEVNFNPAQTDEWVRKLSSWLVNHIQSHDIKYAREYLET